MRKTLSTWRTFGARAGVAAILVSAWVNADAAVVTVGANEWRQLTDTQGFTWTQVAAACPTNGAACTGAITRTDNSNVDVTGWTWASIDDIRALFDAIVDPTTTNFPNSTTAFYIETATESFIDNIVGTGPNQFQPTWDVTTQHWVTGWSATAVPNTTGAAYNPFLLDGIATASANPVDEAYLLSTQLQATVSGNAGTPGVWLRRPVSNGDGHVPEPATLALFGLGLAGLGAVRRRRTVG